MNREVSIATIYRIANVMEAGKKKDYEGMLRVCQKSGRILKWGIRKYCVSKEEPKLEEPQKAEEEQEEPKFKVGDLVKVRNDLEFGKRYGKEVFVSCMEKYKGKLTKIKGGNESRFTLLGCGVWRFTPSMVEKVEAVKEDNTCLNKTENEKSKEERPKYKIGDLVKVRDDLKVGEYYGGICFTTERAFYRGVTAKIEHFDFRDKGCFVLEDCDGWDFSPEMLEKAEPKHEETKVDEEPFGQGLKIGETVEEQQVELSYRIGNVSFSAKGSEKWVEKAVKSFREIVEVAKQGQEGEKRQ